jgi:hypothetical protein
MVGTIVRLLCCARRRYSSALLVMIAPSGTLSAERVGRRAVPTNQDNGRIKARAAPGAAMYRDAGLAFPGRLVGFQSEPVNG